MQEEEQGWLALGLGCGMSSPESWAKWDPGSLSWKMLLRSVAVDSPLSLERLPISGTMRNGQLYPHRNLEPSTNESGRSLLPTICAREGRDWSRSHILAKLDKGDGVAKRICSKSLTALSYLDPLGLHPCFGEWMMGFPVGWTDLRLAAMPLSQTLPNGSEHG